MTDVGDIVESVGFPTISPLDTVAKFSNLSGMDTQLAIGIRINEYQQQIAQLNERILALKSIHNAVTPLHTKLPSEILIHIFRHIKPNARQHIQITHVCRLWRSAIHKAAEFWLDLLGSVPVLDHPHGRQLFGDFFERTAPFPFGISLKSSDIPIIRQLPTNHLLRISLLSITFSGNYSSDLLELIDLALPSLRHLACDFKLSRQFESSGPTMQVRNAPPSDKLPRLVSLNIHGRCITPAFFVASLRDVEIFGAAVVSPVAILNALRACPCLESLTIEDINEEPVASQALTDLGPPIPMERLRSMTLSSTPLDGLASAFLSHLEYPATTQIRINGQGWLLSHYLCHSSSLISTPAASTVQRVTFTLIPNPDNEILSLCKVEGSSDVAPDRLSVSLWYGPWGFPDHDHPRRFLDFANAFSSSRAPLLTNASITLEHGLSMSYEDWHTVLTACPQIRHFAVRIASCRRLLRLMRRHQLLPRLETLSITCENGSGVHESLVVVIESRATMDVSRLDELRFCTEGLARRKNVDAFPPFSNARLERLKAHVRDVYVGAEDGAL